MPATRGQEARWQLVWQRHEDWKRRLQSRNIRPITIVVTKSIKSADNVAEDLIEWLAEWQGLSEDDVRPKVLVVTSNKDHQPNLMRLRTVDDESSDVEWIVSVSMLSEGWDVKNVFQIVPHEERAFNSKLLIAQVLGRGLRRPDNWAGEDPVVTVFNHDAWSGRIKHLVNEVLEIESRVSSRPIPGSTFDFQLHNLDYTRTESVTDHPHAGEYQLFDKGYVAIPSQVVDQEVTIEFSGGPRS